MKPATFFFALALILLFAKHSLSSRAIIDDTIVYDSRGNPLEKDAPYFIMPVRRGINGGGVLLSTPNENNGTCEADVLQSPSEVVNGIPFTFTPAIIPLDDDVVVKVKLDRPVFVQSAKENPCEGESTVWKVSSRNGFPVDIITTGGIMDTPSSCLTITRPLASFVPYSYEFQYCPYKCGEGPKYCRPIGIYERNYDLRYLSPNSLSVFEFRLVKAPEPAVIKEVI